METVAGLAIIAFSKKGLDFIKYITNKDWNATLTQIAAWIVSILAVLLVGTTSFADGDLFGLTLSDEGIWGQIVLGLLVGSTASFANDSLKVFNRSDHSLGAPSLIPALAKRDPVQETIPLTELEVTDPQPKPRQPRRKRRNN